MRLELEVGDFLPNLPLLDQQSRPTPLMAASPGRPLVVLFLPETGRPACQKMLRSFAAIHDQLTELAVVYAVTNEAPAANNRAASQIGVPFAIMSDPRREAAGACGVRHNLQPGKDVLGAACVTSFVTDANRRILQINRNISDDDHPAKVCEFLKAQPRPEPREMGFAAPVILVPKVFDRTFCQRLIDVYETQGNDAGTLLNVGPDGVAEHRQDPNLKIRRDHYVNDQALMREFKRHIGQRILPEIQKATYYPVTRFEEFKICCYDATTGGHFASHRDNANMATAHRRFAMTLNLNTGAYEGGHLCFPEYGPHLYRPGTGDAVVFSCSLVHKALPVTKGKRYVLLAFLFGEEDQHVLQQNEAAYREKRGG